jgi:carboxymethylenebutenolidase
MDQKIIDLCDEYARHLIDRREFFRKLTLLAGGAAAAYALMPLLENNLAAADIVSKDDPRLYTEYIRYPGATGEIRAYSAKLKGDTKLPGVIVIHENRGLNPHIEDVTRRIAAEGFTVIAPDALSPLGGTPKDSDEARLLIKKLDYQSAVKDYTAAIKYLKTNPLCTGKVGVVGFCWGGRMANQMAVNSPDLIAAVPYYGSQPASEDVSKIRAALLLHYAGNDDRINKGIAEFERALKAASVDYKLHLYPNAKHAFNNDTNPGRYNKETAQLAWKRTIMFLNEKLKE